MQSAAPSQATPCSHTNESHTTRDVTVDSADDNTARLAFTTDSFVVDPIFFPGGDIGALAVNGTVNDLACCGAKPLWLSAGFILEEGLPLADLKKIVASLRRAADAAGVAIVTGDTKVVERGKCDRIFINTSGVGMVPAGVSIGPARAAAGDAILCSGPRGAHGITILAARKYLGIETNLVSDTAPLNAMIAALLAGVNASADTTARAASAGDGARAGDIHGLRDPTRGGVAGVLTEIAQAARVHIEIDEAALPIPGAVAAASELLGIDPLHIANEGIVLVVLPEALAENALAIMRAFPAGSRAVRIGSVNAAPPPPSSSHSHSHAQPPPRPQPLVCVKTPYGGRRIVTMPSGEPLPRIC
jgi:hydrogenase expression/formation protein HypE